MRNYKFKINGNEYDVEINSVEGNIADVTVNGASYKVEMDTPVAPAAAPVDPAANAAPAAAPTPAPAPAPAAPAGPVICPCCGAKTVPDANGCCPYCGEKVI